MENRSKWEPIVKEAETKLRNAISHMHRIWDEIGVSEESCALYRNQILEYINDLLQEMVDESESKKNKILTNVQKLMAEMATIANELRTEVGTTGYENLPLKEVEERLQTDLEKLQHLKEQRMDELKILLAKEKSLCKSLGIQPINIEEKVPSEEEINGFRLYLEKHENEKNRLESIFQDTRRTIIKMMDDLGTYPTSNFENLVCNDNENFVFTTNNMIKLKEFQEELKHKVDTTKEHVNDIKQELVTLWKHLDEPQHICQSFLDTHVGYSLATINALTVELDRCKEKRKQNISKYVSQVRCEITKLWDLCKYNEEQRKEFLYFNVHTYTEDLLTLHELELQRLQDFYKTNKPIFELVEKHENLWLKMKELYQRANDPDRFYNRGGQLLIEEKERKTIQKQLPKIQEELKNLVKEHESTHGEPFTINGLSIEEMLNEAWTNFSEEKETIKKARKEAKDKSMKLKTTLSASKKNVLSASRKTPNGLSVRRNTPTVNASKRKLLFSPSPNNSAKRRNVTKIPSDLKHRRSGKILKKVLKSIKSNKEEKENSAASADTDTTYGQFKEHLKDRGELRSSLLPEQFLAGSSKPIKKTPVRTPVKPLRKNIPIIKTPMTATTPTSSKSSQSRLLKSPRSPRTVQSSKLATVSTPLPIIF